MDQTLATIAVPKAVPKKEGPAIAGRASSISSASVTIVAGLLGLLARLLLPATLLLPGLLAGLLIALLLLAGLLVALLLTRTLRILIIHMRFSVNPAPMDQRL
jgi:hypothetical protein